MNTKASKNPDANGQEAKEAKTGQNGKKETVPTAEKGQNGQSKTVKKADEPLSIDQKLSKIENLHQLKERRDSIIAKKREVDAFKNGSTGVHCQFTLQDAEGNSFQSSNSEVIELILNNVRAYLDRKQEETEAEIKL